MPKISIIIPIYNHAKEINRCLKSIFAQTFQDFEIIIVNDGSTDNIEEKLKEILSCLKDSNFKQNLFKIITQENKGAPVARNRGAKEAKGEYLLFCDADLILKPKMLEKMTKALDANPKVSYVYSSFYFGWKLFRLFPFDEGRLKKMPYIPTTSLVRRKDFLGFDEKLKKFQDWDLWLTMLEQNKKGLWISEALFKAQPRKSGMSHWLPKIFLKIPWERFGFKILAVERYKEAKEIIKKKHGLI